MLVCLVAKGDEAVGKSNIQKSAMGKLTVDEVNPS